MAKEWVIRGVPEVLAVDMWWLAEATDSPGDRPTPGPRRQFIWHGERAGGRFAALAGLVALADVLFYGHAPGLSLALFAVAVLGAVMALSPAGARLKPGLLLLAAALPVVDHVQPLSLAFLLAGLLASLLWVTGGLDLIGHRAMRLLGQLPLRGVQDMVTAGVDLAECDLVRNHRQHVKSWAFPLGGGLVLVGLLLQANPVLDQALARLLTFEMGSGGLARPCFWIGAALLVWPLIARPRAVDAPPVKLALGLPGPSAASVARGLVLFNAILAVQTLMDAAYLWGGASLPDGMTAAEYAHRGAYPLLVTALLAGAFALAARTFAREDGRLRMLLLLWLGQNLLLTVSALMRLELYVDVFGLTYLRLYAAIWMGLVAAGLGLIAWQVWRDRPNLWLLIRTLGLGIGTLYLASFVNFAAIIAAENLSRPDLVDDGYVCSLGPTAAAAIAASGTRPQWVSEYGENLGPCPVMSPMIEGWRDWGFRNWRVSRYLEEASEAVHEDPRRG